MSGLKLAGAPLFHAPRTEKTVTTVKVWYGCSMVPGQCDTMHNRTKAKRVSFIGSQRGTHRNVVQPLAPNSSLLRQTIVQGGQTVRRIGGNQRHAKPSSRRICGECEKRARVLVFMQSVEQRSRAFLMEVIHLCAMDSQAVGQRESARRPRSEVRVRAYHVFFLVVFLSAKGYAKVATLEWLR